MPKPKVGDNVVLTGVARWRHLGLGLQKGMPGAIEDITGTHYALLGKYPKVGFTIPFEKRYWIRLEPPTKAMRDDNLEVIGMSSDEFRTVK